MKWLLFRSFGCGMLTNFGEVFGNLLEVLFAGAYVTGVGMYRLKSVGERDGGKLTLSRRYNHEKSL
jgi:hypothetical protein